MTADRPARSRPSPRGRTRTGRRKGAAAIELFLELTSRTPSSSPARQHRSYPERAEQRLCHPWTPRICRFCRGENGAGAASPRTRRPSITKVRDLWPAAVAVTAFACRGHGAMALSRRVPLKRGAPRAKSGGPPGDRTQDTVIKSHVLYH